MVVHEDQNFRFRVCYKVKAILKNRKVKRTSIVTIIFIMLLVLVGLLVKALLLVAEYKTTSIQMDFTKIVPSHLMYQRDSFAVQRKWVKISDAETATHLTAFIYYPVLSETYREVENLPHSKWQIEHIETIRKRTGDSLAVKMAKARVRLAINGKVPDKKLPLIVFGPGLGWLPTDYTYLLASLASKGYVVIALTGIPISKQVYFPDSTSESVAKINADYQKMGDYLSLAVMYAISPKYKYRRDDSIFALIDTNKVFAAGHSVSGASALIAASHNKQIKGIINLDGDVNNEFEGIQPTQSILYITTQPQGAESSNVISWNEDRSEKRRDNAFLNNAKHSVKAVRIKIPEMYHLDFLDVAINKAQLSEKYQGKSFGSISFEKSFKITLQAISEFVEGKDNWDNISKMLKVFIQTL